MPEAGPCSSPAQDQQDSHTWFAKALTAINVFPIVLFLLLFVLIHSRGIPLFLSLGVDSQIFHKPAEIFLFLSREIFFL